MKARSLVVRSAIGLMMKQRLSGASWAGGLALPGAGASMFRSGRCEAGDIVAGRQSIFARVAKFADLTEAHDAAPMLLAVGLSAYRRAFISMSKRPAARPLIEPLEDRIAPAL